MLNFSSFENAFINHYPPAIVKAMDINYVDQILLTSAMTDLKNIKQLSKQVTTRYRKGTENISNKIRQSFIAKDAKETVKKNFEDLASDFSDDIEKGILIRDIQRIYKYDSSIPYPYKEKWDNLASVETFIDFLVETFIYAVLQPNEVASVTFPCPNVPPRPHNLFDINVQLGFLNFFFSKERHLVYLYGDIGTGKTSVVAEYIYRNHQAYNLIWWLNGKSLDSLTEGCLELLEFLGLSETATKDSALFYVRNYLNNNTNYLLVIDNADGVEDHLNEILPQNKTTGHVIVISRNQIPGIGVWLQTFKFTQEKCAEYILRYTHSTDAISARKIAKYLDGNQLATSNAVNYICESCLFLKEYLDALEKNGVESVINRRFKAQAVDSASISDILTSQYFALKALTEKDPENELYKDVIDFLEHYAFTFDEEHPVLVLDSPLNLKDFPENLHHKLEDELYLADFRNLLLQRNFIIKASDNINYEPNTLLLRLLRNIVKKG